MQGQIHTELGSILIDADVVATYAGSVALGCSGIVGMASLDMRDGLMKLLKKENITRGIEVEIEDNGKGIEAKNVPYIFERFYRTDASRNSAKGGSGIGLSIVKKILEDHGGKVWATSVEGEGTTICFVIRKYQEVER